MCALPSHVKQTHTEKELELLVFHADNTLEVKQIILTFSQLQLYRTAKYELNVEHPIAASPCARALNTARPSSSRTTYALPVTFPTIVNCMQQEV
jgi:hypothetical protein